MLARSRSSERDDSRRQVPVDEVPEDQVAGFWIRGRHASLHGAGFWCGVKARLPSILVAKNGLPEMARFWTSGLPRFSARNITISRSPNHVGVLLFGLVTTLFYDTAYVLSQHRTMASASSGKLSDAPASYVDTQLVRVGSRHDHCLMRRRLTLSRHDQYTSEEHTSSLSRSMLQTFLSPVDMDGPNSTMMQWLSTYAGSTRPSKPSKRLPYHHPDYTPFSKLGFDDNHGI